jgi:uncharacterized sulfatase
MAPPAVLAHPAAGTNPPNVLVILVDDLNLDLGTYGHPMVQTPNIDRIAATGMRFDLAVCNSPVCNPSRVSMMTGTRPSSNGVRENDDSFLGNTLMGVPTLPFKFKTDGYQTGGAGKIFHLSHVEPNSWDDYQVSNSGTCNDPWVTVPPHPVPADTWKTVYWGPFENGPDGSLGTMCDTKVTDAIIGMMDALTGPFFLVAGYVAPHVPFVFPESYEGMFDPNVDVDPAPAGESSGWQNGMHPRIYESPQYLDPAYAAQPAIGRREATVAYWQAISYLDDEVGRLLDHLETKGLDQNTVVVFVSDHGWSLGLHQKHTKFRLFEHSLRVPLIVSAPGQANAGASCAQPVELIDVYPTLMEACGLTIPANVEGQSLMPLIADPVTPQRSAAFSERYGGFPGCPTTDEGFVVHTGTHKLVHWTPLDTHQFYDLTTDPGEYVNQFDNSAYDAQLQACWQMLIDEGLLNCDSFWTVYGTGTSGTLGIPSLTLGNMPVVGQAVDLILTSSTGAPSFALHITGLAQAATPLWGGSVLLTPMFYKLFPLPAAGITLSGGIPDDRRLCGLDIFMQVVQLDAAGPGGFTLTPGLHMIAGAP